MTGDTVPQAQIPYCHGAVGEIPGMEPSGTD